MAGLGFSIPKIPLSAAAGAPGDMSMQDKLMMLSAALRNDQDGMQRIPMLAAARRQAEEQEAAQGDIARFASGQPIPQRPAAIAYTPDAQDAAPDPMKALTDSVGAEGGLPSSVPMLGQRRPISVGTSAIPMRDPAADAMGSPVNARNALPLLMKAWQKGVNTEQPLKMIQAAEPQIDFVNGLGVDKRDGSNVGRFIPQMDKGQEPLFDSIGKIAGIRNVDGSVKAAADMAGAVAGAQEGAKAGWDLVDVPLQNGSTVKLPRALAAPMLAAKFGNGSPAGFGQSQAPSDAAAAKIKSESTAGAQVDLPQVEATAQQAIDVIHKLRDHPALKMRTGAWAMAPAIPGTSGASFDAMKKQLEGQIFLDAYASLKGGGQITEVEGKKATAAKARLDTAQTSEDFTTALDDLEGILSTGLVRSQRKAVAPGSTSSPAAGPTTSGHGYSIVGVRRGGQ